MTKEQLISAHADPEGESPWALQIVVEDTKDFSPLQLALATAKAVVSFLGDQSLTEDEEQSIRRWMQGRIRKVVRRAKNAAWTKAKEVPGRTYSFHGVNLHVVVPTAVDDLAPAIKKAQVSGLQTIPNEKSYIEDENSTFTIFLNRSLDMSAPKAAVAAAHAAQLMARMLTPADYYEWEQSGYPMKVTSLIAIDESTEQFCSVVVHDAGFTEVSPGSATSMGLWTK